MNPRRAVFFDRDGTLMEEVHYCGDPAKVKIFPGVTEALGRLKEAGFLAIIVSNQSGIGRGLITEAQYHAVQEELLRQIGPGLIDGTYFCPDPPWVASARRKPEPGMLFEAAADFAIDLKSSYLIGDKKADMECGRRVGMTAILVLTGYGTMKDANPEYVREDVLHAVQLVLQHAAGASD
jgi:D-glycero-D-manno-heptose 1,7-bisphosphate phosphatase